MSESGDGARHEIKCKVCGFEGEPRQNAYGKGLECPKCEEPVGRPDSLVPPSLHGNDES